ncbi:AraC family transcriptional regulator [Nocardioides sp. W3-2-3]|nr:AraC family transcriptional regulator [Nocardioides convexus]
MLPGRRASSASSTFSTTSRASLWTLTTLADRAGVSPRSLQEGFARYVGASPMRYLTQVRLDRAHHRLQVSDPDDVTASTIASTWGFTNYGRFAQAYRRRFGASPAATLRG